MIRHQEGRRQKKFGSTKKDNLEAYLANFDATTTEWEEVVKPAALCEPFEGFAELANLLFG